MISKEEVLALAELARLQLNEGEVTRLQKDMSDILNYVGHVSAFEVKERTNMKPVLRNIMREDVPRAAGDPLWDKEEALRSAFPTREHGFNVVRKIIQKDE